MPVLNEREYVERAIRSVQAQRYPAATEIVIASGREDPNVDESRRLAITLQDKGVPASLHLWDGWAHDWPYWKEMVDVFL